MKKILNQLLLLSFLSFSTNFAQETIIAKVGNTKITSNEFKIRYEFTPKVKSDFDSSRVNFLYSLIAEKLWTLEAYSLSMDTSQYVINSVRDIERKLVKDKLYKNEIESKIEISEQEIVEAIPLIKQKRIMQFLFSEHKNTIDSLHKKLKEGESFDSLLIGRAEENQQINGIPVVYGQMDEKLEKELFSLNTKEFSAPIPINIGWAIYYIKSIEDYKHPTADNIDGNRKFVKETIFERKAHSYYNVFFDKYIKGSKVNADKILFNRIVNEMYSVFGSKNQEFYNEYKKKYELNSYQIKNIRAKFSSKELSSKFVKFESNPINLNQYLNNLELNLFMTENISKDAIANSLQSNVQNFIFNEILVREGYSRNLQYSDDIRKDIELWKSSFLASYYKYSFIDSVKISDKDSKSFYEKVVSNSPDSIEQDYESVKSIIEKGLYFSELENKYIDQTVHLAKKYGISLNTEILNSLKLTDIEMMVYRKLGFGGEISAVPFIHSFYKWKNWLPKEIKQTLPE